MGDLEGRGRYLLIDTDDDFTNGDPKMSPDS